MNQDKISYKDELGRFVRDNHDKLSMLYGIEPELLSDHDLKTMVNYSFGLELKRIHVRTTGDRFDEEAMAEIKLSPKEKRSIDVASKAIAHKDVGYTINKPIHKAREKDNRFGKFFSERIDAWRIHKMRKSFNRMVAATVQIEARTKTLIAFINYAIQHPSPESRRNVTFAIRQLNGSLVAAHTSARAGAAWALRSGFASRSVSRAISTLYIQRMGRLANTYKKLDTFLEHEGIRSNIYSGIVKRKKILSRELMLANADNELSRGVSIASSKRYGQNRGLVYG